MLDSRVVYYTANERNNGFDHMVRPSVLLPADGNGNNHRILTIRRFSLFVVFTLFTFLVTSCADNPLVDDSGASGDSVANETSEFLESTESEGQTASSTGANSGDQGPSEETQNDEGDPEGHAESTPSVNKQIVLCLGGTTESLYPYGSDSSNALGLQHAIYESLYSSIGYDYQAQGLEKLPSLADGDAVLKKVMVEEGMRVQDVHGDVVMLVKDVIVRNSAGEEIKFDGTPLEMEQMVVDFSFRPMVWSDGQPVTGGDSVFSFNIASDPQTATRKNGIANTQNYEATGERSVRWTGIPGHMDQTYFLNVWPPLPSHQLMGKSAAELKALEETTKMPLSSGPYVVAEWTDDGNLVLSRNEHYYRQDEGYPKIDRIIVRFGNGEEFLAGNTSDSCDVIADGALLAGNLPLVELAAEESEWDVLSSPGPVFEHIAFGINPVQEYADRRPDWFEDVRVRQAMTMCTDRQRMIDELTDGRAELLHTYVSENQRLFPEDLAKWPFDPGRANNLLDEAGYLDFSEDGRRQDVSSGIPMTITLGTNSESSLRLQIAEIFQENMASCGIPVELYNLPAGTWLAEGPAGRVFGRHFDLAEFAWLGKALPDCGLYLSKNITGPEESGFGGWQNTNVTGWSSEEFDKACLSALNAMPSSPGYDQNQQEALRIFANELPVIPLFTNFKVAAVRPWMRNVELDASQPSLLWNIAEWDFER